ncbi:sensor histidine kinase [Angustibacter sp. McL0619]|uniref:sensor histidine kinase n=1 Tax=Angustibacter sp. McL0619 TaxID=3415676 RepID=UPI003CEACF32
MDPATAATLGGVAGLALGGCALLAVRWSERAQRAMPAQPEPTLPRGVADVLAVLRESAVVVAGDDSVVKASPAAYAYGIVSGKDLTHPELRHLVRQVRRDGVIRESELELARGPLGPARLTVRARVAPLSAGHLLLLVEDRTQAHRVEEVRRDFVANVSHELKTPIGGLSLLAEAVQDASDDPAAVQRFAARMQVEASRLSHLVQEIVDLSRLQVADTLHPPRLVVVDEVIAEAVDRCRLVASAKDVELAVSGEPQARVFGDRDLLMTALRNLVDNAIAYSGAGTRVSVAVTMHHGLVEVKVTDQGVGISEEEQARIFERFYRVDPARSRSTGGTGLGLAIVKHVSANHGGEVTVWSQPGEGSTFTVRLPAAPGDLVPAIDQPAVGVVASDDVLDPAHQSNAQEARG